VTELEDISIILETTLGLIEIAIYARAAPRSAAAFLSYIESGSFAAGGAFYRVVRGAENDHGTPPIDVVQGGSLSPSNVFSEIDHEPTSETGLRHLDGTVSLARKDGGRAIGAAFFICVGAQPVLDVGGGRVNDGKGFAAFGKVTNGMSVIRQIYNSATSPFAATPYRRGQMLDPMIRILNAMRLDHV